MGLEDNESRCESDDRLSEDLGPCLKNFFRGGCVLSPVSFYGLRLLLTLFSHYGTLAQQKCAGGMCGRCSPIVEERGKGVLWVSVSPLAMRMQVLLESKHILLGVMGPTLTLRYLAISGTGMDHVVEVNVKVS